MKKHDEEQARVIIAGGSGFLGMSLAKALVSQSYQVVILSRSVPEEGPWEHVFWDGRSLDEWTQCLEGAVALINLAGRSVDCQKTPEHIDEIFRSRVESTSVLGEALRTLKTPPPVWIQMSTAHIYGDPGAEILCDETTALGYGLAPDVGRAWEETFKTSVLPNMRSVIARTGFVLGTNGGALMHLQDVVRWGIGGTTGSGEQGMSWIHEADFNRFCIQAINDSEVNGTYVVSSPKPVANKVFMRQLRKSLVKKWGFPAKAWMVRFGARYVIGSDPELILYGRYVIPQRLLNEGFTFVFPELEKALHDLNT